MRSLSQKAMVRALVWVSGEENSATNAQRVSTRRAKLRTNAWKYSSPLPCEAASTIARSAVEFFDLPRHVGSVRGHKLAGRLLRRLVHLGHRHAA